MTDLFSCDWGTSSFRLRRVELATGQVLDERRESIGVKALSANYPAGDSLARREAFASYLRQQLLSLISNRAGEGGPVTVIVSGMASSSVGWIELPYAPLPFALNGDSVRSTHFDLPLDSTVSARVCVVSGVAGARDMMRGEETEILGLFAQGDFPEIARDGIVVLPGTHSKHTRLRGGWMDGIQTYMTGELFEVLAHHSLLRASVEVPPNSSAILTLNEPVAKTAFVEGVCQARDEGLPGSLFQVRTRTVLSGAEPAINRWFLSGLLIGAELVDLARSAQSLPILLAATGSVSDAYRLAFATLGLDANLTVVPPATMATASVRGHLLLHALGSKSQLS